MRHKNRLQRINVLLKLAFGTTAVCHLCHKGRSLGEERETVPYRCGL